MSENEITVIVGEAIESFNKLSPFQRRELRKLQRPARFTYAEEQAETRYDNLDDRQ